MSVNDDDDGSRRGCWTGTGGEGRSGQRTSAGWALLVALLVAATKGKFDIR